MLKGYARVSTKDQKLFRQLDQLKEYGCEKIYQEKFTGTKKDRPEFTKLIAELNPGDTVIVTALTRLTRSTKDLFFIADQINKKGADLKSLKESWLDTTTSHGKLLFTIFAGIIQFESDLTSERTKEGLASARARGRVGGRPRINQDKIDLALTMYRTKTIPIREILKATGISKQTLYRYVNKEKNE